MDGLTVSPYLREVSESYISDEKTLAETGAAPCYGPITKRGSMNLLRNVNPKEALTAENSAEASDVASLRPGLQPLGPVAPPRAKRSNRRIMQYFSIYELTNFVVFAGEMPSGETMRNGIGNPQLHTRKALISTVFAFFPLFRQIVDILSKYVDINGKCR